MTKDSKMDQITHLLVGDAAYPCPLCGGASANVFKNLRRCTVTECCHTWIVDEQDPEC